MIISGIYENRGRNIVVILPDGGDSYLSIAQYGK